MEKKVVFSGVQPSGLLTIGNYIGAIGNFEKLQEDYDCFYSIVDMHAITLPKEPKKLREQSFQVLALYIASGLNPEKSTVFIQSHVHQHAELSWVLSCLTYMGQLNRMTQYKDKAQKHQDSITAGLFTYPVLMTADILMYQTDYVPVGEDQRQHLELARDIAERFNSRYSPTFVVPEGLIPKETGKIMSLKDPTSKMSKSDEDPNASVFVMDDEATIMRKIKRAVTDSEGNFAYRDEQAGLKNLIHIYQAFSGMGVDDIVRRFEGENYGSFKEELGGLIYESLKPVQERYKDLMADKSTLENYYRQGAQKASYVADKTLRKVYRKIGFLPR